MSIIAGVADFGAAAIIAKAEAASELADQAAQIVSQSKQDAVEAGSLAQATAVQAATALAGQNKVIDTLQAIGFADGTKPWTTISGSLSGTGSNGGTVNTSAKTITIASGQTGIGSYLEQTVNPATFADWAIQDRIQFRLVLAENPVNLIDQNLAITLTVGSTPVTISPTALVISSGVIGIEFDYTLITKTDALKIRIQRKTGAPAVSANSVYTWQNLSFYNATNGLKQFAQKVNAPATDLLKSTMYKWGLMPQWYGVTANGSANDSAAFQAAVNAAIATSKYLYVPAGSHRFLSQIVINGEITIEGLGDSSEIIQGFAGNLIDIKTNQPVRFKNFKVSPATSSETIFCNLSQIPGISSLVEATGLTIDGLNRAFTTENCSLFVLRNSTINTKDYAFIHGFVNPASVSGLVIEKTIFKNQLYPVINCKTGKNIKVLDSQFIPNEAALPECYVKVEQGAGLASDYLHIKGCQFGNVANQAVYMLASSPINDVVIHDNTFKQTKAGVFPTSLRIAYNAFGVQITSNRFFNKGTAVYVEEGRTVQIVSNTFKAPAENTNTRAIHLVSCTEGILESGNLKVNQSQTDII